MGLLSRLFGSSDDQSRVAETPDDDPRDEELADMQRPYRVETEECTEVKEQSISGSFTRTVELLTTTSGQHSIIEYDSKESRGLTTHYYAYTGSKAEVSSYGIGARIVPKFDRQLIEINEQSVFSRKTLGLYPVKLSGTVELQLDGVYIIDGFDSIPDECMQSPNRPRTRGSMRFMDTHNYVEAENPPELTTFEHDRRSDFHSIRIDGEYKRVLIRKLRIHEVTSDGFSVEVTGSTGEIIADSVETGTEVMRAVLSDGTIVVPNSVNPQGEPQASERSSSDDEQGLTDEGSDLLRIAELAER